MYVAKTYCVYLWTEPEVCHGYYKFFCYYFLPQQCDVLSPGHPLLPETPKPGYFSLSHKLIHCITLAVNFFNHGAAWATHPTAPQGSSLLPNKQNSILILSD